jgi:hypothetical protein
VYIKAKGKKFFILIIRTLKWVLRPTSILSSHFCLSLQSGVFRNCFPTGAHLSEPATCSSHLIIVDLIILIIFDNRCTIRSSLYSFSTTSSYMLPLSAKYSPQQAVSKAVSLRFLLSTDVHLLRLLRPHGSEC